MSLLGSHDEYVKRLEELEGKCAFCSPQEGLVIREYIYWTWEYCKYPYWKYHTLLMPKRHMTGLSELTKSELVELQTVIGKVEMAFIRSGIVSENSTFGTQLLMFWRKRFDESYKKPVAHLHLHVAPERKGHMDLMFSKDATDIDMDLLRREVEEPRTRGILPTWITQTG